MNSPLDFVLFYFRVGPIVWMSMSLVEVEVELCGGSETLPAPYQSKVLKLSTMHHV
jgi:hypothetical protein